MITVKNKKVNPVGEYIGRGSPLGNPFDWRDSNHSQVKFQVKNRAEAISSFKDYLLENIRKGEPEICDAVNQLIIKNLKGEDISLVCFCKPNDCHGDVIKEFVESQKYCINWFSNMRPFEKPLIYQDFEFQNVETFYQAMKTKDKSEREKISKMKPFESKRYGKTLLIREDWEKIKLQVMEYALRWKFQGAWAEKLKNYQKEIVEWNNWGDKFWGRCIFSGLGNNHLGKILAKIQHEIS